MNSQEDINYQLKENFIFFLDILKQPEEVFDCRSREYKLVRAWLDKLAMGSFETTDELRQRNICMSHLLVCLNNGKLTGPFLAPPKQEQFLDIDFEGKAKQKRVCPRPLTGMKAPEKACLVAETRGPCECDFVCCDGDDDRRNEKKACSNTTGSSFDLICGYMTQYVNIPACLKESLDASLPSILHLHTAPYHPKEGATATAAGCKTTTTEPSSSNYGKVVDSYEKCTDCCAGSRLHMGSGKSVGDNSTARTLCNQQVESDQQEMYGCIATLLKAIASELRGEQTPGSNDFLEYELARYKNFIKNYSHLAGNMFKLQDRPILRPFLLLNLQNDLVKLLPANMKRAFGFG
ncbi:PREDICTED: uncharacterized protein LOC108367041 [Rhagoletis zephyria]|uniref:uncharacterized protein LOC108367041 n=1 Tax=Rhagoletis zephyria TaxID=28612 RepID=UPI000811220B|nr:PREDICTED: uncharacterized protein LOC108367041 [Rhagoletis zephyria]